MNEEFLIKNTTREQREKIVRDSLGYESGCESCGGAMGYDMYTDYIEGRKELREITMEFRTGYISEDLGPEGMSCNGSGM
jgi:hypothetical protein